MSITVLINYHREKMNLEQLLTPFMLPIIMFSLIIIVSGTYANIKNLMFRRYLKKNKPIVFKRIYLSFGINQKVVNYLKFIWNQNNHDNYVVREYKTEIKQSMIFALTSIGALIVCFITIFILIYLLKIS
jgi:hypothetical protein